ncbi:hypothetical protein GCM10023347_47260 [Streptomyces chumphonensis]
MAAPRHGGAAAGLRGAVAPTAGTAGIRVVSAEARLPGSGGVASFTRKLTWLTMTCAGSLGTLTELRIGSSSK